MKKKFVALILIALISCFLLSAQENDSNWFDLSMGFSIAYKDGSIKKLKKMDSFRLKDLDLSLEVRSKLFFFETEACGKVKSAENNGFKFSGMFVVGFSQDLFNVIRLSLCMGPTTEYVFDGKKGILVIDGYSIEGASFSQVLKKSRFNFRLSLDFFLGPVLKIGASVAVPTDFSLESHDLSNLALKSKNLENTSLALVFCMTLI